MKTLLLAIALATSPDAAADSLNDGAIRCSSYVISGGALPAKVDGASASQEELFQKRVETTNYIERLEAVLEQCRPGVHVEAELVRSMELAAKRFNRELRRYRALQVAGAAGGSRDLDS